MEPGVLRCPVCRAVQWYYDGLTGEEHDDGSLVLTRADTAREPTAIWTCTSCGYEVPSWTDLGRRLASLSPDAMEAPAKA